MVSWVHNCLYSRVIIRFSDVLVFWEILYMWQIWYTVRRFWWGLFCFECSAANQNAHKQIRSALFAEPADTSRTLYLLCSIEFIHLLEVVLWLRKDLGVDCRFPPAIMIYAGRNKFEVSQTVLLYEFRVILASLNRFSDVHLFEVKQLIIQETSTRFWYQKY